MTLAELYDNQYPNANLIGVYEKDERGNMKPLEVDFADEYLETHGERVVKDHYYSMRKNVLVVELI